MSTPPPPQVGQQRPVHGLGPEDVGPSGQIDVVDDHVKGAAIRAQPSIGVADDDFDPGRVECHVPAGQADHLRINLECGEPAGGQEAAQKAQGGSTGQPEHEQGTWFLPFSEERGGGQHVPDQSGEEAVPVMEGMRGAGHPELGGEGRLPDF